MKRLQNAKPHGGGRGVDRKGNAAYLNRVSALYGASGGSAYLPKNWHDRLPDPATYYAQHVDKLGKVDGNGWAIALCPFHDDHALSLSVKLVSIKGAYRCRACEAHGDMVDFHMARTELPFKEAVRDLIGLRGRA